MTNSQRFLFVVCQVGAEEALKKEISRRWPDLRFAYSRPGFVTFKLVSDRPLDEKFDLRSTFARTYSFSLGKVTGEHAEQLAAEVGTRIVGAGRGYDHLHVWQRDVRVPGERGFEPGVTLLAQEVGHRLVRQIPGERPLTLNQEAGRGHRILDCVLVDPTEWWVGYHVATSRVSRWPGGVPPVATPRVMVSRAYLKASEALAWSGLPIEAGEMCAEIGSAPGGASQALLERGVHVLGIDPAEVDPLVRDHPNFVHIRKRAAEVRRRELRGARWLLADSNVAPRYTLDSVESVVMHRDIHVRGMLLTLKLLDWKLADEISTYVERVRSWGYKYVNTRQLAYNRREFCLAALRSRSQRRVGQRRRLRRRSSKPAQDR